MANRQESPPPGGAVARPILRSLVLSDLPAARALSAAQGWPHREEDWRFVLGLGEGVAAEHDGQLAGTALGLGVLGAGAYFIDAADSSQTRHLMLATGLATLVGSVLDGVAGATSRRLELGAAQCVLGAIAGCGAVIAGASVASAALAGGAAGLLSWACPR